MQMARSFQRWWISGEELNLHMCDKGKVSCKQPRWCRSYHDSVEGGGFALVNTTRPPVVLIA
jgi:hypothetical protein